MQGKLDALGDVRFRVVWMTLVGLPLFAACALAQVGRGGLGVTVFADPDYGGESATFREDVPDLRPYRLSDRISSIRVPPGEGWEVCQDIDYGNRCAVFSRSEPDLRRTGWNDRISSVRRVRGGGPDRSRNETFFPPGGPGVTVFADPDYQGERATFREDVPDLRPYRLSDRISSIRVPPGEVWEVCQDINYGNRCQVFSRSEPDLRRTGWNDRISSVRRVRGGGGLNRSRTDRSPGE